MVELVDEADGRQPHPGALAVGQVGAVAAEDGDPPGVGMLQQARGVQQARLARSRRPDQADDLARHDVEVDAAQDGELARAGDVALAAPGPADRHARASGLRVLRRHS